MSKLRAIVFDFDGVILDSANVKTEAFVELYAHHGAEVTARVREHHLANLGISRFKKFEWIATHILGAPLTAEHSRELGEQFSALALSRVLSAPFICGAQDSLAQLASKYPLFVASGTPQEELDTIVDRRGLRPYFREIHGTPREKPEILRDIMQRFGLSTSELLFIGDGMSDYKAASAVGVEFLALDTADLHDAWTQLHVCRVSDLSALPRLVHAW